MVRKPSVAARVERQVMLPFTFPTHRVITNMLFQSTAALIILTSTISISGCANVPTESIESDAIAKSFITPNNGMAAVYIIRNSPLGQTSVLELSINGVPVSKTAPYTYVRFDLKPGRYYIGSRGENYQQMPLILRSGEIVYIKQSVSTGWSDFRTDLIRLNVQEGKDAVLASKFARKLMFDDDIRPMDAKN